MRKVNRSSVPAPLCLVAKDKKGKTEYQRAKAHQAAAKRAKNAKTPQKPKPSFEYSAYKKGEVKRALATLFHGKCAYCETFYSASSPVDVEHYRPKGSVDGVKDHPGYWWLAMRWENLLPSCIDCNRRRGQWNPSCAITLIKATVPASVGWSWV